MGLGSFPIRESLTHATPAAFYAQVPNRTDEATIAKQALDSDLDLLLGGGLYVFKSNHLIDSAKQKGWQVTEDISKVPPAGRLLGLFTMDHYPYVADQKQDERLLEKTAMLGLERLEKTQKDFFLLIEAGRLDHAAHDGDPNRAVRELISADSVVKKTIDYINRSKRLNLKNTSVLVVADHETGGMAINGYFSKGTHPLKESALNRLNVGSKKAYDVVTLASGPGTNDPKMKFAMAAHTGMDIPCYAWGFGASQINGTLENTEIFGRIQRFLEIQ